MARIKAVLAMALCGLSTFSIMPNTNYSQHISNDAVSITRAAWQKTGRNLKASMDKVGSEIEQERNFKQQNTTK